MMVVVSACVDVKVIVAAVVRVLAAVFVVVML